MFSVQLWTFPSRHSVAHISQDVLSALGSSQSVRWAKSSTNISEIKTDLGCLGRGRERFPWDSLPSRFAPPRPPVCLHEEREQTRQVRLWAPGSIWKHSEAALPYGQRQQQNGDALQSRTNEVTLHWGGKNPQTTRFGRVFFSTILIFLIVIFHV